MIGPTNPLVNQNMAVARGPTEFAGNRLDRWADQLMGMVTPQMVAAPMGIAMPQATETMNEAAGINKKKGEKPNTADEIKEAAADPHKIGGGKTKQQGRIDTALNNAGAASSSGNGKGGRAGVNGKPLSAKQQRQLMEQERARAQLAQQNADKEATTQAKQQLEETDDI